MSERAALLLHGGRVRTIDPAAPRADWVLVENGRVQSTGLGPPPTHPDAERVDLRGRTLLPGFCDAHVHLAWLATATLGCDLSHCDGPQAAVAAITERPPPGRGADGEWLVGYGFDETTWAERRLPTRQEIDAVQPRRPVLLQRVCGHLGVVNSAALARLAAGPHTDSATGRIAEDDLYIINDLLRPSPQDLARSLEQVARLLHAHGITAVHDVTSTEMLEALESVGESFPIRTSVSVLARMVEEPAALRDRRVPFPRVRGVKLFLDGSLGGHTAYLRDPYADEPGTRGVALYDRAELEALARRIHEAGLQLMVHAIGDAALDLGLDVLAPLARGGNPLRHRLEHIEVTPADLVRRLASTELHACVQPNFAGRWSIPQGMNGVRLGAKRLAYCNAYRTLRKAGVPLAFGSDCMPLGPAFGLQSAVEHPIESERLDLETALELYTAAGAALVGAEREFGRIAPGLRADFTLWNRDPEIHGWKGLRVEAVFLGGRRHDVAAV